MHSRNRRPSQVLRAARSPRRAGVSARWLLAALFALCAAGSALAQRQPLGSVLPDTTVAAFYYTPDVGAAGFFDALAGDLDLERARSTVAKLGRLLGEAFDEEFGSAFDIFGGSSLDAALAELGTELESSCPALVPALHLDAAGDGSARAVLGGLLGPTVLAVSAAPYDPMPALLVVSRPTDREAADRVYDALVACFDAGLALKQDSADLHVFADGSDQPLLAARVDGWFMASTDQDLLRASVRLALGSSEPSHISRRVGSLAAGPMSRGIGMTIDLAAIADVLEGLRGNLPQDGPGRTAANRLLASLRVVNGVAVSARFDDAGLAFEALVTVDEGAARASGETALLDLLTCSGCSVGRPALVPAGAAGVWAGTFSAAHLTAWLDTWLHDLRELGAGDLDVRGLVSEFLGVDLDAALLDWIGTGWHTAQLGVYDTDVRSWLVSPGTVTVVPVTDEGAARRGLQLWQQAIRNASGLGDALFDSALMDELGGQVGDDLAEGAEDALTRLDLLSVQQLSYRGVSYERWRLGPVADASVLVIGGQLVIATPADAIEPVIDVYLGAPSIASDARLGPVLASQPLTALGYEVVDGPRYLLGLARVADLASAPLATVLQFGVIAGLDGQLAWGAEVDQSDVPTFDELVALTDLGTQVLEALAARTGVAVGTTENVGGVIWSTWRVPLRR